MALKKTFKFVFTIFIILCICLSSPSSYIVKAEAFPVNVSADTALVIDIDRGQVLYNKYSDKQFPALMSSKLMTALIAIETLDSAQLLTASINAAEITETDYKLTAGSMYSCYELIATSIMTLSDSTLTVLYESIEPDPAKFVERMNNKAVSLSMTNTHFSNPLGSSENVSYTTARDLASFMTYAFNIPLFKEIFCSHVIPVDELLSPGRSIKNSNYLLWSYHSYAQGGTILKMKNGMVSSITYASRLNMNLMSIVIDTDNYEEDNKALFDHCLYAYEKKLLAEKGKALTEVEIFQEKLILAATNDVYYVVPNGKEYITKQELIFNYDDVELPIDAGTNMGTLKYTLEDGTEILVSLQTMNNVYSNSATINDIIEKLMANKDLLNFIIALCFLVIIMLIIYIVRFILVKLQGFGVRFKFKRK